jgi:hypothetical protein
LEPVRKPMPSIRNAMSRVKKSIKKARVERSVQLSRMKVKMNHPYNEN